MKGKIAVCVVKLPTAWNPQPTTYYSSTLLMSFNFFLAQLSFILRRNYDTAERYYMLNNELTQENEIYINVTFISQLQFWISEQWRLIQYFIFSCFLEKSWKLTGHLIVCATQEKHNFLAYWAISLCPKVWFLITILIDLVCCANDCKIIESLIRWSHRICVNDSQL